MSGAEEQLIRRARARTEEQHVQYDFFLAGARILDGAASGFLAGTGLATIAPSQHMNWTFGLISAAAGALAAFRTDLSAFIKAREAQRQS